MLKTCPTKKYNVPDTLDFPDDLVIKEVAESLSLKNKKIKENQTTKNRFTVLFRTYHTKCHVYKVRN